MINPYGLFQFSDVASYNVHKRLHKTEYTQNVLSTTKSCRVQLSDRWTCISQLIQLNANNAELLHSHILQSQPLQKLQQPREQKMYWNSWHCISHPLINQKSQNRISRKLSLLHLQSGKQLMDCTMYVPQRPWPALVGEIKRFAQTELVVIH